MEDEDAQEEQVALEAIYMENYARLSDDKIRIIAYPEDEDDENGASPPIYLEMTFPSGYPAEAPSLDLSNGNNSLYPPSAVEEVQQMFKEKASELAGACMVYDLVEALRSDLGALYRKHKARPAAAAVAHSVSQSKPQPDSKAAQEAATAPEHATNTAGLTKAQKRRYYDRFGANEEKPRGWDWVDIVSHLSKK